MSRVRQNINREWKFFRGDAPGAERADFDDSSWQRIGLPHCFDLPYFRTPEFYVGVGWYRKVIRDTDLRSLPAPSTGRRPVSQERFFLEFDGVFQVAEVFANGQRAGEHRGGYTGFSIDITEFVKPGENLLAVRVNNNWNPRLALRAGEHIFSGGIYRDVNLSIKDPVHISWNGVTITTPHVNEESADARFAIEIANTSRDVVECTIETSIDGVGAKRSTKQIATTSAVSVDQPFEQIANPGFGVPDQPNLYIARMKIFVGDELVDEVETPFGFRWFEWTKDRGFFLNGKHLYLRGANAHQDHAGWGIGITRAACERDVRLIKDAGFHFVRGSHYPHHPAFADACDRVGLLFMSENCFWGKGGFGPEGYWNASAYPVNEEDFAPFEEHCKQTLREMIRINRNHPSIIAWSMCNEPFFTYNLDRAKSLLSELVKVSHAIDPTRPAAIGGAQRGDIDKLGYVACYNGDGARLFIDPGVPSMVSEYGAIHKPPDVCDPFFGELQPDRFPWRSGEAIWCAFDYGTIAGKQGLKGIVDHARLPKQSWHWYRKENLGIDPAPAPTEGVACRLRLSADKTTIQGTDATDDCHIIVSVCDANGNRISNSPSVTLTIESGPGEFPTGRSITFDARTDIKIVEGNAGIEFRSYHGGESVIRATSPGLLDATIAITTIGSPSWERAGSPIPAAHAYVPPEPSEASLITTRNAVNVALHRPSRASSAAPGNPAHLANDGEPNTFWRAETFPAHWTADLEGFYQLASLRVAFLDEGNFRFVVDVSRDDHEWRTAIDRSKTENTRAERSDIFPPGTIARHVRIRFTHVPAGLSASLRHVELFGILSVR